MDDDYYISSDDDGYDDDGYNDDDDDRDKLDETELEYAENNEASWPEVSTTKVISKESLLIAQREDLQRVMDVLSLKEYHARTLLIHYCWDVDKVLAVYVERGIDRLYAEAGVTMVEHDNLSSPVICNICFDEVAANEVTMMDCGHYFCNDCWTEHFIVKINDGQSRRIKCMAHKCNAICDEEKIRNLVSARDPNLAEKFERFLLESYIEDNRKVKWCPSVPHCGNAIRIEEDELCEVECACGLQFCFRCLSVAHSPCSCKMWELWYRKCQDESETVNYIAVNTKPCPKCNKLVEKNGGCNLVTCICGQPFCWLCGGATGLNHTWESIEGHSCGRFKEDEEIKLEQAKRDLVRYTHYFSRYQAHKDSLKLESALKESIQGKILRLEERESTSKDFSWATNGFCRLFRSRRIISFSYPFAYYMFGENLFKNEMTAEQRTIKLNLFEDHQQQLEGNMEKLSMFTEEPFDNYSDEKLQDLRMRILNLSTLIDKLCAKLYECIENDLLGSIQGTPQYISPYKSNGVEKASELTNNDD